MSKQHSIAAQKAKVMLRRHVGELVEHTQAVSDYNTHGHAQGKQGRTGHAMPKTNLNLQSGARLIQNVEGENCAADEAATRDYGIVDNGQSYYR